MPVSQSADSLYNLDVWTCVLIARSLSHIHGGAYSKGLSHRNRLAGGSQSISKFSREIEPTVSQFLNVHGKLHSASHVSVLGYFLSVLDN